MEEHLLTIDLEDHLLTIDLEDHLLTIDLEDHFPTIVINHIIHRSHTPSRGPFASASHPILASLRSPSAHSERSSKILPGRRESNSSCPSPLASLRRTFAVFTANNLEALQVKWDF